MHPYPRCGRKIRARMGCCQLSAGVNLAIGPPPTRGPPLGNRARAAHTVAMSHLPPTPCLVIEQVVLQRNIRRMADYAAEHHLKVRPHIKTHKSRFIARLQLQAGAAGLTTAKVGEALEMAHETDDLLIAYPALDGPRTQRIATLALTARPIVAIDSAYAARALQGAAAAQDSLVGILIDLDLGVGRTGLQTPRQACELGKLVMKCSHLQLKGIFCYTGHVTGLTRSFEQAMAEAAAKIQETLDLFHAAGLPAPIVSGGSTPSAFHCHLAKQLTEIRPGTYVFNDLNSIGYGCATPADCAALIHATVVSSAVPGQVVLDAGSKTLTSDRLGPAVPLTDSLHGFIPQFPQARITKLTEEHAQVDVTRCIDRPRLGQRVQIIPNHICPWVNLQETAWLQTPEGLYEPLPIEARGMLV